MAVNCWSVPLAIVWPVGVTATEDRVAVVTVMVEMSLMPPTIAVMSLVPTPTVDTLPLLPTALETVATDGFSELHVADSVRSWAESSV